MFNETEFLNRWNKTDFSNFNEMDIREEFIRDLLYILGYSKNTINGIIREKTLDISEPFQRIGRKRIQIDYVPTIRLKSFWILEAKPGKELKMDVGDMLQAYLYATHPEIQVPYIVLCNGWKLEIYDVNEREKWDEPFFTIDNKNCNEKFDELKNILSADKMLNFQRMKLLRQVEDTFEVEFDLEKYKEFNRNFNKMGSHLEKKIKNNKRELKHNAFNKVKNEELKRIEEADDKELIGCMDYLGYASRKYNIEYYKRISMAKPKKRAQLIRLLHQNYLGRPHSIFRINYMIILQRIVINDIEIEESIYFGNSNELLKKIIKENISYVHESDMHNALVHMDKLCCKLSALTIKNGFIDIFHKLKCEKIKHMSEEEKVIDEPTVAKMIVPLITIYAELLWRLYAYKSSVDEMWKYNWTLMKLIETIEKQGKVKNYPDSDSDLLGYELYGDSYDMLFTETIRHIRGHKKFYKEFDESILEYIILSNEKLNMPIPKPNFIPDDEFNIDSKMLQEIYITVLKAYGIVINSD